MQHDMQLKSGCFFVRVQYSKVLYTAKHTHTKIRGGTGTGLPTTSPKLPGLWPTRSTLQAKQAKHRSGPGRHRHVLHVQYGTAVTVTRAWHDSEMHTFLF